MHSCTLNSLRQLENCRRRRSHHVAMLLVGKEELLPGRRLELPTVFQPSACSRSLISPGLASDDADCCAAARQRYIELFAALLVSAELKTTPTRAVVIADDAATTQCRRLPSRTDVDVSCVYNVFVRSFRRAIAAFVLSAAAVF